MPQNLQRARVGPLTFDTDFPVPAVDVKRSTKTVEHETINNNNVIQIMGEQLPQISIDGVIYGDQVKTADSLVGGPPVEVHTHRWTGMGVVNSVDTSFRREADPESGKWIYDLGLDIVGTQDYIQTDDA